MTLWDPTDRKVPCFYVRAMRDPELSKTPVLPGGLHGVALHGLLGISELTPCAQKRREAGRPVGADMAPDDPVLLRQLTRMICLSELTQQTACRCVSYIQRTHARRRSRHRQGRTGCERGRAGDGWYLFD